MSILSDPHDKQFSKYFIRTAKIMYSFMNVLLVGGAITVFWGIFTNLITPILPPPLSLLIIDIMRFLIHYIVLHVFTSILLLIIIFLIYMLFFSVSKLPVTSSEKELINEYLKHVSISATNYRPTGLPSNMRWLAGELDIMFLAPHFHPNHPLTDYCSTQHSNGWSRTFYENKRIELVDIWNNLTKECPVAVVYGYPGMGKSILLDALRLYMSCRRLYWSYYLLERAFNILKRLDAVDVSISYSKYGLAALKNIHPPMIPILVNLTTYQQEKYAGKVSGGNPLLKYIENYLLEELNVSSLDTRPLLIHNLLENGSCLFLFDALDEANKDIQLNIQEDVRKFIIYCRSKTERIGNFNRFLITSRIADHDENAFPDYADYMIAELTSDEIEELITRYYHVIVNNEHNHRKRGKVFLPEAESKAKFLKEKIDKSPQLADLVKTPLFLHLLIVIIRDCSVEDIDLPQRKIDIYTKAMNCLLIRVLKHSTQTSLSETKLIQYLGKIAVDMQNNDIQHTPYVTNLKLKTK